MDKYSLDVYSTCIYPDNATDEELQYYDYMYYSELRDNENTRQSNE